MTKHKIQVLVRLKPSVLDVQGKAIEGALKGVAGADGITNIRVGKCIEMDVDAATVEEAKKNTAGLCELLLANTLIEDFEIKTQ